MTCRKTGTRRRSISRLFGNLVLWAVSLSVLLAGLSALGNTLLHYEPWTTHAYEIIPNAVCPGDETGVRLEYSVTPPKLGTVAKITTHSRWVNVDTDQRLTLETDEIPFSGDYGTFTVTSDFTRFAPSEPGNWALDVYHVIDGTQAFRIAEQTTPTFRSTPVVVRPCPT